MEEVISGMAGYIPLKAIGQRILAQYTQQQFGDFRGTLLGLLSAYNYESSILTTARCASCYPPCMCFYCLDCCCSNHRYYRAAPSSCLVRVSSGNWRRLLELGW